MKEQSNCPLESHSRCPASLSPLIALRVPSVHRIKSSGLAAAAGALTFYVSFTTLPSSRLYCNRSIFWQTLTKRAMPEHPNPKQRQGNMTNAREPTPAKRRALVVGINDYQDANNHLPSCINDVNAFEKMLKEDYAFQEIVRLVDSEAAVGNVTVALKRLFADASPNDRLVFFFSGHGSTELRNGVIEQCMVLYDGFFFDDVLSQMTQSLPPGIFTLVADCCFSGGLEKRLLVPLSTACGAANRARVKAYTHPTSEKCIEHVYAENNAIEVKRFGEATVLAGSQKGAASPASLTQLNGVLLSACLENETASASNESTGGKSAFTFALLHSLKELGRRAALDALTRAAQSTIDNIGLTQTPTLKEPPDPGDLRFRTFINFEAAKADETSETATDLTSSPLDVIGRVLTGGSTMDVSTLIQMLISGAKENISAEQTSSAKDSASLTSAIASMIAAAVKELRPNAAASSLLDQAFLDDLAKGPRSADQKLFGISNAALMSTIASIISTAVKGRQPDEIEKNLLGHVIRVVPMVADIVRAVVKGQQPSEIEKSLVGHAIRVVRDLIKDQQPVEQKLFGLDHRALSRVINSVLTAVGQIESRSVT